MRAFAPGKLVLTGAYAVLEGAPAIVVGTSRGAFADTSRTAPPTVEVRAALGDGPAPSFDASGLFTGDRKLGLGASGAILVAALAALEAERGTDLTEPSVRESLFRRAWKAHGAAQSGGSGVDVAASVYGGALRYVMGEVPARVSLPRGTSLSVFACAASARTSELRSIVDRLAESDPTNHRSCMDDLARIARSAADAVSSGDREAFVARVADAAASLARLGEASGAPIVPPEVAELSALARTENGAFCVSGAGGGDVAFWVGGAEPSRTFVERASALGLFQVDMDVDEKGVRIAHASPVQTGFEARA